MSLFDADAKGENAGGAQSHRELEDDEEALAAFRVDATSGLLTPLGSFATEKEPRGFNIDPQGRFLFAVGRQSNQLTTYAIDRASGKLSALRTHAMSGDPNWIEIVTL